MNQEQLKVYAERLSDILERYSAEDPEVADLRDALAPLLARARAGVIESPVEYVPGRHGFLEGNLSRYVDLANAYSEFRLEASGAMDGSVMPSLLERVRRMRGEPGES